MNEEDNGEFSTIPTPSEGIKQPVTGDSISYSK